jgi:SAM-dependent methyltransferase
MKVGLREKPLTPTKQSNSYTRKSNIIIALGIAWILVTQLLGQIDWTATEFATRALSHPYRIWRGAYYSGSKHQCAICQTKLRVFRAEGKEKKECPYCLSRPRHRTTWLYFNQRTNLFDGSAKKMLHVAPEPSIATRLQKVAGIDYLSADLFDPAAMVKMDITDIQYPDNSFDVIYCSHVLEHVPQDRRAMRELARVLKPGGWAVLAVPIKGEKTFEDASVTAPEERERLFGQFDHVRQ